MKKLNVISQEQNHAIVRLRIVYENTNSDGDKAQYNKFQMIADEVKKFCGEVEYTIAKHEAIDKADAGMQQAMEKEFKLHVEVASAHLDGWNAAKKMLKAKETAVAEHAAEPALEA